MHDVVGERSSHLEGEGEADVGACARLCVVDRGAAGACVVSTHAGADREVRFLPLAAGGWRGVLSFGIRPPGWRPGRIKP